MQTTAEQQPADPGIVGRGAREAARLTRSWFTSLTEAAQRGQGAAYVFVMGSMTEVLMAFDFPIVFPEVTALQTAVRGTSEEYLKLAEDYGFSPDICGYVKADVAMFLRGGEHPMGKMPKAALGITTNACNTYFKWAEIWERLHQAPVVTIDVPGERADRTQSQRGDHQYAYELAYVVGQVKELIEHLEAQTGKRFDIDRFREHLRNSDEMNAYYGKVLAVNARTPAVFNVVTDGLAYLGMVNCFRGTKEGATYFRELYEEMEYRSRVGIGALTRVNGKDVQLEQRFRLGFRGVPCYPIIRGFNEMFSDWGGIFVVSSYLTLASGGMSVRHEHDLANPIESYAEGILRQIREVQTGVLFDMPDVEGRDSSFNLDGVVYHGIKSCRTSTACLADRRFHSGEEGLPILLLESDLIDPRAVSKAQMKNRVDAFFEGLISRQQRQRAHG